MNEQDKLELVAYRIGRAHETLQEIQLHIDNQLWTTAVNRLYYACFYAVSALLLKNDIITKSHSGARQMFGLHFVKTGIISKDCGKFYSDIFDMRQTGDYDDFVEFSVEEVMEALKLAKLLISEIDVLISK